MFGVISIVWEKRISDLLLEWTVFFVHRSRKSWQKMTMSDNRGLSRIMGLLT